MDQTDEVRDDIASALELLSNQPNHEVFERLHVALMSAFVLGSLVKTLAKVEVGRNGTRTELVRALASYIQGEIANSNK